MRVVQSKYDGEMRSYATAASTAYEVGDILYWDATNEIVKPVSEHAWTTSDAETQRAISQYIVGVCAEKKLACDATQNVVAVNVGAVIAVESLDASTVCVAGQTLLAPDGNGSSALLDQTLEDVTDPTQASFIALSTGTFGTSGRSSTGQQLYVIVFRPEIHKLNLGRWTKLGAAGDVITGYTWDHSVIVTNLTGIVHTAAGTNALVYNLEKNTTDITGDLTLATTDAAGKVVPQALTPTLFNTTDTMSLEQSGTAPSAGEAQVIVTYWHPPVLDGMIK